MTASPLFNVNPDLPAIDSESISAYLASKGWVSEASYSPLAKIWYRPDRSGDETELIVPTQDDVVDFRIRIAEVFRSLQKIESRPENLIARDIAFSSCDIVRLKRPALHDRGDSILLKDGAELLKAALKMMTSAACSTVSPRAVIPARRPPLACDYINNIRMGHTERGSYVLTIISKVAPQLTQGAPNLLEYLECPFPRKVTKSLCTSLSAIKEATEQVANSDDFSPFFQRVDEGITASLCEAIRDMVVSEVVEEEIGVSVSWAPSSPVEGESIRQFQFQPSMAPILTRAADFLRQAEPQEDIFLTGVVVGLHREEGSEEGKVTISCAIEGSVRQLQVQLGFKDYNTAIEAHGSRNGVAFRADVKREGRFYIASNVDGFRLVDS
jgi:hypothetical protein